MFAVPEVDDDIDASFSSIENTKSSTQSEIVTQPLTSPPPPPPTLSSTPVSTTDKEEKTSITTQIQSPPGSRQHLSRLSHFQRNTIHICEQIPDNT